MVEFALVLPLVMLLLIGIVDFGRAINYWIDSNHLANAAARWAVVDNNPGADDGDSLQEYIRLQAGAPELENAAQVCISFPDDSAGVGDPVEATVTSDFNWIPFLDLGTTTLSGSATMRLEALPTEYAAECSPS